MPPCSGGTLAGLLRVLCRAAAMDENLRIVYIISEYFILKVLQWPWRVSPESDGSCAASDPDIKNNPPNCPPTSVLLVLKLKFYTKIFALYSRR